MADFNKILPRLIERETGVRGRPGEFPEQHFLRAAKVGYHDKKTDRGGPTFIGVTLSTFRGWCKTQGQTLPASRSAQTAALKALAFDEWRRIAKSLFWDPSRADMIEDQRIATMVVDQRWVGGVAMIKAFQRALALVPDGIVGPKTLAALNAPDRTSTLETLRAAAIRRYNSIADRDPSQGINLRGWINRVNSI